MFSLIDLDGDGELTESEFIGVRKLVNFVMIKTFLLQGCVQDRDLLTDLADISLESLHRFAGPESFESSRVECKMICCWPSKSGQPTSSAE